MRQSDSQPAHTSAERAATGAIRAVRKELKRRLAAGEYYEIRSGGIRGILDASFCPAAQAASFISRLESPGTDSQIIKDDTAAVVWRTAWSSHDIAVKKHNCQGFLRAIRHSIKGSRARRAWLHGHLLASIGIASPKPLAFVEVWKHGLLSSSCLVTSYVEAPSLHQFLRDGGASEERMRKAVLSIAALMETMAAYRISHGDLKDTNILVSDSGIVLTDLDGLVVHRFDWSHLRGRRNDLSRFMRNMTAGDVPRRVKELAQEIFKTGSCNRLSGSQTGYHMVRHRGWLCVIRDGFSREDVFSILSGGICSDVGRFRKAEYSSDTSALFHYEARYNGRTNTVFVKHYLHRSLFDTVKHLFRSSRAKRAFRAGLVLRSNGFLSPEPLALLERRLGPLTVNSILVTSGIGGAVPLAQWLERSSSMPAAARRAVIRSFGRLIGRMHAVGIYHGDLRTDNVLVTFEAGRTGFCFVDNERSRRFGRIPERLRIRNLVQLNMANLGDTDRMRFARAYGREVGWNQAELHGNARKVAIRTMRRLRIREKHHGDGTPGSEG